LPLGLLLSLPLGLGLGLLLSLGLGPGVSTGPLAESFRQCLKFSLIQKAVLVGIIAVEKLLHQANRFIFGDPAIFIFILIGKPIDSLLGISRLGLCPVSWHG
jgi:hypothetical protein